MRGVLDSSSSRSHASRGSVTSTSYSHITRFGSNRRDATSAFLEPDNWFSLYAEIGKESGEVVGQILMSSNAECSQTRGIFSHWETIVSLDSQVHKERNSSLSL